MAAEMDCRGKQQSRGIATREQAATPGLVQRRTRMAPIWAWIQDVVGWLTTLAAKYEYLPASFASSRL